MCTVKGPFEMPNSLAYCRSARWLKSCVRAWAPQVEANQYIKSQTVLGELNKNKKDYLLRKKSTWLFVSYNKTNWLIEPYAITLTVQPSHNEWVDHPGMDLHSGVSENVSAELVVLAAWSWACYLYSKSSHRISVAIKQGNAWQTPTIVPKNDSKRPFTPVSVIEK